MEYHKQYCTVKIKGKKPQFTIYMYGAYVYQLIFLEADFNNSFFNSVPTIPVSAFFSYLTFT